MEAPTQTEVCMCEIIGSATTVARVESAKKVLLEILQALDVEAVRYVIGCMQTVLAESSEPHRWEAAERVLVDYHNALAFWPPY